MISLSPECVPCFFRQADVAACAHGAAQAARRRIAARVGAILADARQDEVPARVATRLHAAVRDVLGTDDPFRQVKEREFARFAETAARTEAIVASSADPTAAAVWLAAFGNIMDSGIIERESMEEEVGRLGAHDEGRRIPAALGEALADAATVGVLLDNAGEAAFDVPLISRLAKEGRTVWIGVKGAPVIDDLTEAEAHRLGLSAYGEIVSNGNRGVGTDLALCDAAFRERIARSDLILSKGQANFETLSGRIENAFFLFRCKCPVVARALRRPEGALLVVDARGAE